MIFRTLIDSAGRPASFWPLSDSGPAAALEARGGKDDLLDHLMNIQPSTLEGLASRLLREADFDSVNVTGRSGAVTAGLTDWASIASAW
jgi:hypothetical protein